MAARATTKASAPAVPDEDEFEEIEDDETEADEDEDLEELEEVDEEDEAPAKPAKKASAKTPKATTAKTEPPKFGSAELAAYITEKTGETYDGRSIRMLLRRLAKDGSLDRVVGETRDRYTFTGPNDPTVKTVLKMVQDGTAKAMKQEGLQKLKDAGEAKKAAAKAAKEAEVEDEDVEEVDEEETTPKARTRRAAPAKAATPAKATPAKATTTRRRAATTAS